MAEPGLVKLRERYDAQMKDYLSFCYQYLNFYTGLLSAILAATIAGLMSVTAGGFRGLILLAGPVMTLILTRLGYSTIRVFYLRHIEAYVNLRNIEEMLADEYNKWATEANRPPWFETKDRAFTVCSERPEIQAIIEDAKKNSLAAEELVKRITESGDTLSYAKKTLWAFAGTSIGLSLAILLTVYFSVRSHIEVG